ncbi:MAG TPA: hypothetical protein VIJ11_09280 [Galbitalea sp.]
MRRAVFIRVAFALVALAACRADAPVAPSEPGHSDRNPNFPAELYANYTPVELPGAGTGIVADINDGGDAVGVADGAGAIWRGAAHTKGDLPFIPAAIANDGTIAGNLHGHAVMFKNGQLIPLDTASSTATAICRCASETIVGSVEVNGVQHAAIWVGGVRIDAGLPPDGASAEFTGAANGRFVGNADVPTRNLNTGTIEILPQAFSWSHDTGWHNLMGSWDLLSSVTGVNSQGIAVGSEVRVLIPDPIGVALDTLGIISEYFGDPQLLPEKIPDAINDSGTMAGNDYSGSVALLMSLNSGGASVLPPGNPGDFATSINSSNVIGGRSGGKPVLWVPSP